MTNRPLSKKRRSFRLVTILPKASNAVFIISFIVPVVPLRPSYLGFRRNCLRISHLCRGEATTQFVKEENELHCIYASFAFHLGVPGASSRFFTLSFGVIAFGLGIYIIYEMCLLGLQRKKLHSIISTPTITFGFGGPTASSAFFFCSSINCFCMPFKKYYVQTARSVL